MKGQIFTLLILDNGNIAYVLELDKIENNGYNFLNKGCGSVYNEFCLLEVNCCVSDDSFIRYCFKRQVLENGLIVFIQEHDLHPT